MWLSFAVKGGSISRLSIPSNAAGIHWLLHFRKSVLEPPLNVLRCLVVLSLVFVTNLCARAESLAELSESFWQWRAQEQPFTNDDIPRIARPEGFVVDWSAKTIAERLDQLAGFEQRWKAIAPSAGAAVKEQVDYRLLGSALARVRWELAIQQNWKRDPEFYVDQTLGSVFILLLPPPPFSESRQQEIVARMKQIPATIETAEAESDRHAAAVCAAGDRCAGSCPGAHAADGVGAGAGAYRGKSQGAWNRRCRRR